MNLRRTPTFVILTFGLASIARAAEPTSTATEKAPPAQSPPDPSQLAKAVQNPVANLVTVPFQDNLDYSIGPQERARNTLNIQPVIPIDLNDRWMLITRTIVPILHQPDVSSTTGGSSGLGDINPTLFVSPRQPGKVIWGVGPAFVLPTATERALGTGKWSVGPSAVVLVQPHPWTVGVLASNVWSFAGPDDRATVDLLTLQYFVNYNFAGGLYLTSSPILTANWKASAGNEWLIPFGGGVGKIFSLGKLPLNGQLSAYYNAVRPDDPPSPHWQLRVQIAMLFPR